MQKPTFDDVLLVPRFSPVESRSQVNLETQFTTNIKLKFPVVSSNMDTVTEDKMAITVAEKGGIGIIHRFCSIEQQVKMIESVRRSRNFVIDNPYFVFIDDSEESIDRKFKETGVSMLLVYANKYSEGTERKEGTNTTTGMWQGILLRKTFELYKLLGCKKKIESIVKPVTECYTLKTVPKMSSIREIFLNTQIKWIFVYSIYRIKLICLRDIMNILENQNANIDKDYKLIVGAAIGVKDDFTRRATECIKAGANPIVVDIAHGHSIMMKNAIERLRDEVDLEGIDIVAGNVATPEGVKFLAKLGVNGIKIGIGNGSICSTRIVTGCGYPQFSAVLECAAEARRHNIPIISDGGHQGKIGNICKAIVGGANTVMLGNFLAGTDEAPGQLVQRGKEKVKIVRGMAGITANRDKWRKEGIDGETVSEMTDGFVAEGVDAFVKYKGSVKQILNQIDRGLRSSLSYCGVQSIAETRLGFIHGTPYIQITESGKRESGIHGVHML